MVDSGKPELVTVVRNSRENSAGAGHKILISGGGLILLGEGGGEVGNFWRKYKMS